MPIVAVTGTSGKTTTARTITHGMRAAGRRLGLTTSDGADVDGTLVASGDKAGPQSAREILAHPRVDFAVLETARGGIRRAGLAFDRGDVGVVTDVASDHLGLKGVETLADLARVGTRVPAVAAPSGVSVLNADSRWTAAMARDADGGVILFCIADDSASNCGRQRCLGRRTPRQP